MKYPQRRKYTKSAVIIDRSLTIEHPRMEQEKRKESMFHLGCSRKHKTQNQTIQKGVANESRRMRSYIRAFDTVYTVHNGV